MTHPLKVICHFRYLVLGGESFPSTTEVITWQDWDSPTRKRVFNIYGTTEMSCWALMHEVTKKDLEAGEIPLGSLLDDTSYAFSPDLKDNTGLEELFLISQTRICFIDNEDLKRAFGEGIFFAYMTGDLVKRKDNKVIYYGRKNDVIKRFGQRVDMTHIESVASEIVPGVACIYMRKNIVLFAKTDDDQLIKKLSTVLRSRLKTSEMPDEIRKISFFPLSENGKISKQQLMDIYKDLMREAREKLIEAEDSFLEAINSILNLKLGTSSASSDEPDGKKMKTGMDSTFRALGGTSFDALRISMRLEDQTGLSNGLLPKLLGDRHSIRDICGYLKDVKPLERGHAVPFRNITTRVVTEVVKRFDMEKCVDASPVLLHVAGEYYVSVGCHSHQVVTVDTKTLNVVSKVILDDRVESEVALWNQSGLVGSYKGTLYCFKLMTGEIEWKFDSKGMIKSKAIVMNDTVIFGNYNYDKNLWCLQKSETEGIQVKWSRLVGSRGILATPLIINKSKVLVCTLDGTVELLRASDGEAVWTKNLDSPIFSTPQIIPGRNCFLVAEVSNVLHCIDFRGKTIWDFRTEGHIFSSFLFHPVNEGAINIIFGCHDKKLRCLNYNYQNQSGSLDWSTELQSQIYGTSRMISIKDVNYIVSCATDGHINFVRLSDGLLEHAHKLPGEIFSTPVIYGRALYVGCRDNFLYCIQF